MITLENLFKISDEMTLTVVERKLELIWRIRRKEAIWIVWDFNDYDKYDFLHYVYHGDTAVQDAINAFHKAVKEGFRVPSH